MASKRRGERPRPARRPLGLGTLGVWALIAAVAGAAAFLVVYAATSGGDGEDQVTAGDSTDQVTAGDSTDEFTAKIVETPSDPSAGQPFEGGPRLYAPVDGVDLGQVPFREVVSYSFDLMNVGDAPLEVEDVQVKMLEGC